MVLFINSFVRIHVIYDGCHAAVAKVTLQFCAAKVRHNLATEQQPLPVLGFLQRSG